jgi:hypothetical protein
VFFSANVFSFLPFSHTLLLLSLPMAQEQKTVELTSLFPLLHRCLRRAGAYYHSEWSPRIKSIGREYVVVTGSSQCYWKFQVEKAVPPCRKLLPREEQDALAVHDAFGRCTEISACILTAFKALHDHGVHVAHEGDRLRLVKVIKCSLRVGSEPFRTLWKTNVVTWDGNEEVHTEFALLNRHYVCVLYFAGGATPRVLDFSVAQFEMFSDSLEPSEASDGERVYVKLAELDTKTHQVEDWLSLEPLLLESEGHPSVPREVTSAVQVASALASLCRRDLDMDDLEVATEAFAREVLEM